MHVLCCHLKWMCVWMEKKWLWIFIFYYFTAEFISQVWCKRKRDDWNFGRSELNVIRKCNRLRYGKFGVFYIVIIVCHHVLLILHCKRQRTHSSFNTKEPQNEPTTLSCTQPFKRIESNYQSKGMTCSDTNIQKLNKLHLLFKSPLYTSLCACFNKSHFHTIGKTKERMKFKWNLLYACQPAVRKLD